MAKPSPVPPKERVIEPSAWMKGENSYSVLAGSKPMPVSSTLNSKTALLASPTACRAIF